MKNKYKKLGQMTERDHQRMLGSGQMTDREQQRIFGSKGSNIEKTGASLDVLLNNNKLSGLGSQLTEAEIKKAIKKLTK